MPVLKVSVALGSLIVKFVDVEMQNKFRALAGGYIDRSTNDVRMSAEHKYCRMDWISVLFSLFLITTHVL